MQKLLPDPLRLAERLHERAQIPAGPAFDQLGRLQQLDAIEIACRSPFYEAARLEALPESQEYAELLALMTDSCITDNEIGRRTREVLVSYMQACALKRGDDLAEFVR